MSKKVLLAGESWMSYTTHVKGFDSFYTSTYETGEKWLKAALEAGGYEVTFLPNHLANEEFPFTMEELKKYDAVILSDIGANTLLLPSATFMRSEKKPNRCPKVAECKTLQMWEDFEKLVNDYFSNITIADLVNSNVGIDSYII